MDTLHSKIKASWNSDRETHHGDDILNWTWKDLGRKYNWHKGKAQGTGGRLVEGMNMSFGEMTGWPYDSNVKV